MRSSRVARNFVKSPIIAASDAMFYYPRFQATNMLTTPLPEVNEAKEALQGDSSTREGKDKAIRALNRAGEVFENLGGVQNAAVANEQRKIIAAKLSCMTDMYPAPSIVNNPRGIAASVVDTASSALTSLEWDEKDDVQFDAMCTIVSEFIRAFPKVNPATGGDDKMDPGWKHASSGLTLDTVMNQVKKLQGRTVRTKDKTIVSTMPALKALEGALQIPLDGNMYKSLEHVKKAVLLAHDFDVEKVGLYASMQSQIEGRMNAWSFGPGKVDELLDRNFTFSAQYYTRQFGSDRNPDDRKESIEEVTGFEALRDHGSSAMLSAAEFYLTAPSSNPKTVYFPNELYSDSPFVRMRSSGVTMIEKSSEVALSSMDAKKRALALLERGLKINRSLFEDRDNLKAGYLLRGMGFAYCELHDYMYATGMMNSARRVFERHYGPKSAEVIRILQHMEHFQRRVGSKNEADATKHQIDALLGNSN